MVSMDIIIDALVEIGGEATSVDLRDMIGCRLSDVSTKLRILSDQGLLSKYPVEGKRGYVTVYVLNDDDSELRINCPRCGAIVGCGDYE
ncbi:MAG TPA: hypothetical protein VJY42_02310 [Candidatus Methanomethylophilaceae archaeon]|nr:hypothetical protein [Candidatus Methanomethylophilaceae archaeon]